MSMIVFFYQSHNKCRDRRGFSGACVADYRRMTGQKPVQVEQDRNLFHLVKMSDLYGEFLLLAGKDPFEILRFGEVDFFAYERRQHVTPLEGFLSQGTHELYDHDRFDLEFYTAFTGFFDGHPAHFRDDADLLLEAAVNQNVGADLAWQERAFLSQEFQFGKIPLDFRLDRHAPYGIDFSNVCFFHF